jgi:hypothetical protein
VGDLNINLNSAPSLQLPRGYPLLRRILDNFHFVDVLLEAGEDGPTWRGGGGASRQFIQTRPHMC